MDVTPEKTRAAGIAPQADTASGTGWTLDADGKLTITSDAGMEAWSKSSTGRALHGDKVTSVVIQTGVTSIGASAFYVCKGMTSVEISDSVTSIEDTAFHRCESLETVDIPDGVMSIGDGAFLGCKELRTITIPEGIKTIGNRLFDGCSRLSNVTIPSGVTAIGDSAFYDCSSLTELTIPDGVTSIGDSAFAHCEGLSEIAIPSGVIDMGSYVFRGCRGLQAVTFPAGITSIWKGTFEDCEGLTELTIPDSVTSIEDTAFAGCTSLTEITLPAGLKSIGVAALYECTALTDIAIPESVTSIGYDAFMQCTGLTSIAIPEGVTSIEPETFAMCSALREITLPHTIESIRYFAFYGCSSLERIMIPSGVTSIEMMTFAECGSLTGVTIPSTVTSIEQGAFTACTGLTRITIPSGVSSIEEEAFSGCTGLEQVIMQGSMPPELTTEDEPSQVFAECKFVTDNSKGIEVPEGTANAYKEAWTDWAEYIVEAVVGDDNIATGTDWVLDKDGVLTITSDEGMAEWIAKGGSAYGEEVTSVKIEDGVTGIGKGAFAGCSGLTKITLPDSVTSIGEGAFSGCTGLTGVTMQGTTPPTVGSDVFSGCKFVTENSKGIEVPEGTANAYKEAWPEWASYIVGTVDEEKVKNAKMAAEEALEDYFVTNETTEQDIQNVVDEALGKADLSDVTVSVKDFMKTEATEDAEGSISCSIVIQCGSALDDVTFNKTIAELEHTHNYGTEWKSDATSHWHECTCGEKADIAAHEYVSEVTKEPTIDAEGETTYTCSVCGHSYTKPISPTGLWISGLASSVSYTGSAIKPEGILVYHGSTLLREKTDYTISYKNNVNAGTAKVIVTGKGNYRKKATAEFTIEAIDLSADSGVIATIATVTETGKKLKPTVTVQWNGKKLKEKKDYTLSYDTNIKTASEEGYVVTISGKGNYTGSIVRRFYVKPRGTKLLSKAKVTGIAKSYQYRNDGDKIPEALKADLAKITVKIGKDTLTKDSDYTVRTEDTAAVGTGVIIIEPTPTSAYAGEKRVTFKVTGTDIKKYSIKGIEKTYPYTGEPIRPVITVYSGKNGTGTQLPADVYTVSYSAGVNQGKATVTVQGIAEKGYSGSIKKTYTVARLNLNDASKAGSLIVMMPDDIKYAKGGAKPQPVITYTYNETMHTLREGADYTLKYSNNTSVGGRKAPLLKITGIGNYSGTITKEYGIARQDMGALQITVTDKAYNSKKKGSYYYSAPKVYDLDGKVLKVKKDYTVQYANAATGAVIGKSDIVENGTEILVTVTAAENGSYTGTLSTTYHVRESKEVKNIAKVKNDKIAQQQYTGKEIAPEVGLYTLTGKTKTYLTKGRDYEMVGYYNNIKKGTATVLIRGINDYSGVKSISFKITAADNSSIWGGVFSILKAVSNMKW